MFERNYFFSVIVCCLVVAWCSKNSILNTPKWREHKQSLGGAQPPGSPVATKLSARQPEYFSKQYAECEVKTKKKVFTSRIHKFSRVLSAKFYYCFQQISLFVDVYKKQTTQKNF